MLGGVTLAQIPVKPNFVAQEKYAGMCKQIEMVYTVDSIDDVMRRAFTALRNGPPGPVIVELTADVCAQMVPAASQNYKSPVLSRAMPEPDMVAAAAKALIEAEMPVIWAGAGVLSAGATAELQELAELISTPVFTTMPGKSAIDERHPLALGAGSGLTTLGVFRWLNESDVMIALGSSLTRTGYGQNLAGVRADKFKIHNTNDPDKIDKEEYADISLLGDAKLTIAALIESVKAQTGGKGCGDRAKVEEEVAKCKKMWLCEPLSPRLASSCRRVRSHVDCMRAGITGTRCCTRTRSRSRTTA